MLKVGDKYRHFKGGIYRIAGFALHTETDENLVLYYRDDEVLHDPKTGSVFRKTWARPRAHFEDTIVSSFGTHKRFELVEE